MTTTQLAKLVQLSPARMRAVLISHRPPFARRTKGGHWRFRDPKKFREIQLWIDDMQPGRPLRAEVCGRQSWKEVVTEGMVTPRATGLLKDTLTQADILRDAALTEREFTMLTQGWGASRKEARYGNRSVYLNTLHLRKWIHRMRTDIDFKREKLAIIEAEHERSKLAAANRRRSGPAIGRDEFVELHRVTSAMCVQLERIRSKFPKLADHQAFTISRGIGRIVALCRLQGVEPLGMSA